ncbi:hypothetical protein HK097_006226 [Rhizophlyctis rosea]|uniref:Uncharacterized protein n=1 Tax=Rhizophlyctis rosea TaxID=64517 RepID=A0AAD5SE80_9FUNG|nr:hypothetical protein HK097_006226 [Rhizophlyctis rosea]
MSSSQPHSISPAGGKTTFPSQSSQPDTTSEKHWGTTQKYQTEAEAWADPNHPALTGQSVQQQAQQHQQQAGNSAGKEESSAAGASAGERVGHGDGDAVPEKHWGTTQKYQTEEDAYGKGKQ